MATCSVCFRSGKCEVLKCSTFKFDSSQGGYNVFQLKSSVSFAMTLTEGML